MQTVSSDNADDEKRYCITMRLPEIDIIITLPADEKSIKVFKSSTTICWIFAEGGVQIMVDKNCLVDFSIEPMQ